MKKVVSTTNAPAAIGPYSQAVLVNNTLYASGQLGLDPKTMELKDGVVEQTKQVFENIKAVLKEADMTMDNVVKTTCFLASMDDFAAMNEVYSSQFTGIFPARSAVAVKTLPKNALIEIEILAIK